MLTVTVGCLFLLSWCINTQDCFPQPLTPDCMIEAIANPEKERMKHDNTNLSLWMQSKSQNNCQMIKSWNNSYIAAILVFDLTNICMACASIRKHNPKILTTVFSLVTTLHVKLNKDPFFVQYINYIKSLRPSFPLTNPSFTFLFVSQLYKYIWFPRNLWSLMTNVTIVFEFTCETCWGDIHFNSYNAYKWLM